MCVASLTLIFTRSVGTLQPMRPLGRVGSKFNWPSEDQCQRSHSKWVFCFYLTLRKQIQRLNSLKTDSKVGDLSSTIAMTAHCFGALSQFRAIGHCVIGQERDLLWPDRLNWLGVSMSSCIRNKKFSSHPKTLELTGKCGVIFRVHIIQNGCNGGKSLMFHDLSISNELVLTLFSLKHVLFREMYDSGHYDRWRRLRSPITSYCFLCYRTVLIIWDHYSCEIRW